MEQNWTALLILTSGVVCTYEELDGTEVWLCMVTTQLLRLSKPVFSHALDFRVKSVKISKNHCSIAITI